MIAPMFFNIWTKTASSVAGENDLPTYPIVVSRPFTLNWSLRVIGIPCKGPFICPVFLKSASRAFAWVRASAKQTSVRQFVWSLVSTDYSTV